MYNYQITIKNDLLVLNYRFILIGIINIYVFRLRNALEVHNYFTPCVVSSNLKEISI